MLGLQIRYLQCILICGSFWLQDYSKTLHMTATQVTDLVKNGYFLVLIPHICQEMWSNGECAKIAFLIFCLAKLLLFQFTYKKMKILKISITLRFTEILQPLTIFIFLFFNLQQKTFDFSNTNKVSLVQSFSVLIISKDEKE